ncbi:hypothetical protein KFE25_008815 [Diacronema lutheri]|uniref:Uncharacterized protein n=2 Tax=Diacronema lutheri TaxID=2081491 RepID=A0A8J6CF71_DIALT|nr:hypothetical protein KFE25_008815 [Diacronema lutheri]
MGAGADELPSDVAQSIAGQLDTCSLHCLAMASKSSPLSLAARRDEAWAPHLNAVSVRPVAGRAVWAQYLEWRRSVYGPRSRLAACERGELPFLRELGARADPHALAALPALLSHGLVVDIVKLCARAQREPALGSKYVAAANWIARRAMSRDIDERRLAAALREAVHRCFPPGAQQADRWPARPRLRKQKQGVAAAAASADATPHELEVAERDALAELLSKPAVRTTCDTFGRYGVSKGATEERWLRHVTTTF